MKYLFIFLLFGKISFVFGQKTSQKTTKPSTCIKMENTMIDATAKNILGEPLQTCCTSTMTGFYRNGRCDTGPNDRGVHVVCAIVTQAFLDFSASRGNDLMTPHPPHFPGLKAGDKWCLCAMRWQEAYEAGVAPPVNIESTHEKALQYIDKKALLDNAVRD